MKSMTHERARGGERGVALALALFTMAALVVGAAGSLLVGADDIQATRNYRAAQQAHFVAESGLTHAIQNINAVGIVDFEAQLVDNWNDWLGDGSIDFAPLAGYSYTVTPVENAAFPANQGWLRSEATGPDGASNLVVAAVQQSNIPGTAPGAIYLAASDPTDSTFQGSNFWVDGNDHNLDGTLNADGETMPGIATKNETNTQETIDSLNGAQQTDQVQGLGYVAGPPPTPSVQTAPTGASVAQLNALIEALLAQPGVNEYDVSQINNSNDDSYQAPACGIGCCTDTTTAPVISHFTAEDLTINGNGSIAGCGIMIVEGDFTIQGTLDFMGLVLVRGGTTISPDPNADPELGVTGDATVYGSIWTSNLNLVVGGSAVVNYSSEALEFADQVTPDGAFPSQIQVLALANCAQVPAGTGGCP